MPDYTIPNLSNACRVLKAFSAAVPALTLRELSEGLSIPHTTALRICTTLCEAGLLERRAGTYLLGAGLISLGQLALARMDMRSVARPILEQVTRETGETAHLAIETGGRALLVEVVQSPAPIRVGAPAGTLAEMHCSATGKVLLAHAAPAVRRGWLGTGPWPRHTDRTLTTWPLLDAELAQVAEQGYAVDEQEVFEGIRCLAAPVRDAHGKVVAAVGITGAAARFTVGRIPEIAACLRAAAARISAGLGG